MIEFGEPQVGDNVTVTYPDADVSGFSGWVVEVDRADCLVRVLTDNDIAWVKWGHVTVIARPGTADARRHPCEHQIDPESFDQCGKPGALWFQVHDPNRGNTWRSYTCTPQHAAAVVNELREQGYVLLPKED